MPSSLEPTAHPPGSGLNQDTSTTTRLACIKATVSFLACREEAKSTDVLAVAAGFEEWVGR